jgi:hypothetical protein
MKEIPCVESTWLVAIGVPVEDMAFVIGTGGFVEVFPLRPDVDVE